MTEVLAMCDEHIRTIRTHIQRLLQSSREAGETSWWIQGGKSVEVFVQKPFVSAAVLHGQC